MPWRWTGELYQEVDGTRTVDDTRAAGLIDTFIDRSFDRTFTPLTTLLEQDEITVNQWQAGIGTAIKDLYIALGTLAAGGRSQMTQQYWGSIGGRLGRQYGYLARFAEEVRQGRLTIGQIRQRTKMYANSARQAYWGIRDFRAREQGFTEERWVPIGDDATCGPCESAGAMGWQPIGTFGTPGSGMVTQASECEGLTNCRCQKVYR